MTCNRVKFWAWISISRLFTYMCVLQDIQKSSWGAGGAGQFHLGKASHTMQWIQCPCFPSWLSTPPPVTGISEKHLLRFPSLPPRRAPTPLRTRGIVSLKPHPALCWTVCEPTFSGPLCMVSVLRVSINKHVLNLQSLSCAEARGKVRYECAQGGLECSGCWDQLPFPLSLLSPPFLPSSLAPPPPPFFPSPFLHPSSSVLTSSALPSFHIFPCWLPFPPFLRFSFPSSATRLLNSSLRSRIRIMDKNGQRLGTPLASWDNMPTELLVQKF